MMACRLYDSEHAVRRRCARVMRFVSTFPDGQWLRLIRISGCIYLADAFIWLIEENIEETQNALSVNLGDKLMAREK